MSEALARVLGERTINPWSHATTPIMGVGLSMEAWARSCASEDPVAVTASRPMWALQCEFPSVPWALMALPLEDALVIPERSWRSAPTDLYQWDRVMSSLQAQPRWLVVQGEGESNTLGDTAREILTRYQRLVPRTNTASAAAEFRKVLSGHRALHDLSLASGRAAYDHSLDTWQWVLRLSPFAGLAVQLAALFHEVERLLARARHRSEPVGVDENPTLERARAAEGAELASQVLEGCGIDKPSVAEVARLIGEHTSCPPVRGADAGLLADADALSFFSLHSADFADLHGPDATRRKLRHLLARMSSGAVHRLGGVRLREDLLELLVEAARAEMRETLQRAIV
jgi:hypothetical protein